MPSDVRMTTPSRLSGSGPKNELKMPGAVETVSSVTADSPCSAARKPPWLFSTAPMTAQMPKIMMMPWMKSFTAVAM